MTAKELIEVSDYCERHKIEIHFIHSLQDSGLIEITTIQENGFLHSSQLSQLEKWVRFYYEIDINLEGIETITHLLQQINNLQAEVTGLKNRLRLYEMND
jgi:hypothetical protein